MASATKRGKDRWVGRYRDASGRERSKTLSTKREAEQWAQEQERRIRRGEWTDPALSRVTVGEWSRTWLGTLTVKPKTAESYESLLRCCVLPRWREVRLDQVTLADVKAWLADLRGPTGRPVSASRAKQAYHVLKAMLDLAVEDGRLPRNPAKPTVGKVRSMLPTVPKARTHMYLTHGQLMSLADAAGDYRALILVLGQGGLRWGEASALRVMDVDLLRRRLHVRHSVSDVKGKLVFGVPKSHATRSVPITATLAGELERQIAGRGPADPLFPSPEGGWLYLRNFRRRDFDPAAAAVGLHGVTPHVLRHTAASLAVRAGANVKAVQRMLGHASAAMTLDVYAGLFDDELDSIAERMEEDALRTRADWLRTGSGIVPLRPTSLATEDSSDLAKRMVGPVGLEPTTRGLKVRCSAN